MRVAHLAFVLLLSVLSASAQTDTCNCLANLNKTIEKTEANYAGYPAKTNSAYHKLVQRVRTQAAAITAPRSCYYILKDYVRFFKDKHFIISYVTDTDFDSTVLELPPLTEGVWMNPDSTLIMLRRYKDGTLKALKFASRTDTFPKGFVYFTLIPNGKQYIVKPYDAFVSTDFPAKITGKLLRIWNQDIWFRNGMSMEEYEEFNSWKDGNHGLAFKKLNPNVSYLKVPSFYNNDDKVQQLVAANDSVIRHTPYLIIDLRGNAGGGTGWVSFLPYLMTNAIIQPVASLRVTPDNVRYALPGIEGFAKNPVPDAYKKYFPDSVLAKYKKAYEELPVTKAQFYPIPAVNFPLDSITVQPKKVAVMFDNFCGSSAEYFFKLASQSKKATTYGVNTIGMMDYEGMSVPTPLPYKDFILTIPVSKSNWTDTKPIDQTGFTPQVILKEPENKWIDLVIEDLKKR